MNYFFNKKKMQNKRHLYHLVDYSPWPLLVSLGAFFFTMFIALSAERVCFSSIFVYLNLFIIVWTAYAWWNDVIRESTYLGKHTLVVKRGLWLGFLLFMASEVMVFFCLFWGYFHFSLVTIYEIGYYWPGVGIAAVKTYRLPLLNTLILLFSGLLLTVAHKALIIGDYINVKIYLFLTIVLGLIFEILQIIEYKLTPYFLTDFIFGTMFYFLTGLHGIHVLIGIIFLIICLIRLQKGQLLRESHLGFEFAIWYWHFVDVVWIFLFFVVYWW